jgi:hypothetical protein
MQWQCNEVPLSRVIFWKGELCVTFSQLNFHCYSLYLKGLVNIELMYILIRIYSSIYALKYIKHNKEVKTSNQ